MPQALSSVCRSPDESLVNKASRSMMPAASSLADTSSGSPAPATKARTDESEPLASTASAVARLRAAARSSAMRWASAVGGASRGASASPLKATSWRGKPTSRPSRRTHPSCNCFGRWGPGGTGQCVNTSELEEGGAAPPLGKVGTWKSSSSSELIEKPSADAVAAEGSPSSTKSSSRRPHPSAKPSSRTRAPLALRPTTRPHGRSRTRAPPGAITHMRTVSPRATCGV
mmetsp:Transcript_11057/g.30636  ORF Transcript_11057/g.30636 Transcript_11057/m.30636 type:complete len:229 (+) Transcript_11057:649-1335(+)